MPASTSTPNRLEVDISDRPAALDRFARLSLITGILQELGNLGMLDEDYPDFRDKSERAEEIQRELDWLGQLPKGTDVEEANFDWNEQNALFEALFPEGSLPDDEGNPEYEIATARWQTMVARLLLRLAEHPDRLRERAIALLYSADDGMAGTSEAIAALQESFERRKGD